MENQIVEIEKRTQSIKNEINLLTIKNDEELKLLDDRLAVIRELKREVKNTFDPIVLKTNQAWKEAVAQRKKYLGPLELFENECRQKAKKYLFEKAREQEEKQKKIDELARKEEEKQRQKLDDRIKKAEEKGKYDKADELRKTKEELFIPAPVIKEEKFYDKRFYKTVWKARVVDESKLERKYLTPNIKYLNEIARITKGKEKIEGVVFYAE